VAFWQAMTITITDAQNMSRCGDSFKNKSYFIFISFLAILGSTVKMDENDNCHARPQ
jgi:hypothetical protein